MENSIEVIYEKLRSSQQVNSDAIEALTKTVDKLALTISEDNRAQKETINELVTARVACEMRFATVVEKLDTKRSDIDKLSAKVESLENNKVSIKVFDKLHNRLWTIGGSVILGGMGVIAYLIKQIFEKLQ